MFFKYNPMSSIKSKVQKCELKRKNKNKKATKKEEEERYDMLCCVFVSIYLSARITKSTFSLAGN